MRDDITDPLNATASSVSRRGFTVLSSAALLGAASLGSEGFGKPHAPIVPESDPDIRVSRPELQSAAASSIGAYAATPASVQTRTGGIVVVQHIWGVDAQIRDVVRRFAKAGFIAVAPLLYGRLNAPSGDAATDAAAFRPIVDKMFEANQQDDDIAAARRWIAAQAPGAKAGITGFCMGGAMVLRALQGSWTFAAASVFYGDPKGVDAARIAAPLLGSYGARDTSIPPDAVRAFFAGLTPPHQVKIYDEAGHAFFDDTRARYVTTAASDAWQRTLAWFQKYLT